MKTFVIGELLNSSRKAVAEALKAKDDEAILRTARAQLEAGAGALDLNAAQSMDDEAADLRWMVRVIQEELGSEVRLALDTASPEVMEEALGDCQALPIVNSVSNEASRVPLIELTAGTEAEVIGLPMGKKGMPKTAEERLDEARALVEACENAGIARERLLIDILCMSAGSDPKQGTAALQAAHLIREKLGVRTCAAVSNVSFGLPSRALLNRTYLAMLVAAGVEALITDPTRQDLMDTLFAAEALTGQDAYCMNYIRRHKRRKG